MFNPSHPGDLIRETIEGLREETGEKLTIEEVAEGLGTTRKTLSAILNKRQGVTPEMALRLQQIPVWCTELKMRNSKLKF